MPPKLSDIFKAEYTAAVEPYLLSHGRSPTRTDDNFAFVYTKDNLAFEISLDYRDLDVSVYFLDWERIHQPDVVWDRDASGRLVRVRLYEVLSRLGLLDEALRQLPKPEDPKLWHKAWRTREERWVRALLRLDAQQTAKVLELYGAVVEAEARRIFGMGE